MFEKLRAAITDDNEISKEWQRFASLALLLFAFVLALFPYHIVGWKVWLPGKDYFSFYPQFESTTIALALTAPLYLRGLLKWNKSPFTTISFVLILGVFASFVEMAILGGGSATGRANIYILVIAIALSWVGIRGIAGIAWVIVLLLGIYNVHASSVAFGPYGFMYVCSAFLGLCFHSGVNPGELAASLKDEYSPSASRMKKRIADDVSAAGQLYRP